MIQLALNIRKLSVPACIQECRRMVTSMSGNPDFPKPNPSINDVSAAIQTLEDTYAKALSGDHRFKRLQKLRHKDLLEIMGKLKSYVQLTCNDDLGTAVSSGMSLKQAQQKTTIIEQSRDVRATTLLNSGSVKLQWQPVAHRIIYLVYTTSHIDDAQNPEYWKLMGATPFPRYLAQGLISGKKYAFVIVAVGAYASGPPSAAAIAMVF